jgi:alpha-galactosidase
MLAAPLMSGNDLRAMSDATRSTLTAAEVLAIDQDPLGHQGRRVRTREGAEVWLRELADGAHAVALCNRADTAREIAVTWQELGIAAVVTLTVRDLWERADRGRHREGYAVTVAPHDTALLQIGAR